MPSKPKPKPNGGRITTHTPPFVEAPKPEEPKPEAPKPEAPKPEAPKPEAPKPDTATVVAFTTLGTTLREATRGMSRAEYLEVCHDFRDELTILIEAAEEEDAAAEEDDGEG